MRISNYQAYPSNSSTFGTKKDAKKPDIYRFGHQLKNEAQPGKLEALQAVLARSPELRTSYGEFDFKEILPRLPVPMRQQFNQLWKTISEAEIDSLRRTRKLGLVEESSDMLFELYTLKALRKKWITPEQIVHLQPVFDTMRKTQLPFEHWVNYLEKQLPAETLKAYQTKVNWPQNPEKAKQFLSLTISKFLLMRSHHPELDIIKASKNLLAGETEELDELLPRFSIRRLQLNVLAKVYTKFPFLPIQFFQNQLVGIVASQLKTEVSLNDLLENVHGKQYRRQSFDYHNPNFKSNKERKSNLKGIELIHEASIVKGILMGRPHYKLTEAKPMAISQ
jgi:hypothetical protein